jgi:hypothetical protein
MGKRAETSTWAGLVHGENPAEFFARFVEAVHRYEGDLTRHERLALVLGLASHEASDSCIHPLVNWCAWRDHVELGGEPSHQHRITEKYQCLFFHLERFGEDVMGTPASREAAMVTKNRSVLRLATEQPVVDVVRSAFQLAHGAAPEAREVGRWVRAFSQFGLAMSSALARRNSMKYRTEDLKRRYYRNDQFDFMAYYEAAADFAIELGNLAIDFYDAGDFSERARARFIAAADLDDNIAAPTEKRCPPLPKAA